VAIISLFPVGQWAKVKQPVHKAEHLGLYSGEVKK
jgi:hypothetical protein